MSESAAKPEHKCGFCTNEKPRHLSTGWRGWFICDECVELLADVLGQLNSDARERMIAKLVAHRDNPPVA